MRKNIVSPKQLVRWARCHCIKTVIVLGIFRVVEKHREADLRRELLARIRQRLPPQSNTRA